MLLVRGPSDEDRHASSDAPCVRCVSHDFPDLHGAGNLTSNALEILDEGKRDALELGVVEQELQVHGAPGVGIDEHAVAHLVAGLAQQ